MNAILQFLAARLWPLIRALLFRAIGLAGGQIRSLLNAIQELKLLSLSNEARQIYAEYLLARNLGWVPAQPLDYTEGVTAAQQPMLTGLSQLQQQFLRKAVKLAYYVHDLQYWLGYAAAQPPPQPDALGNATAAQLAHYADVVRSAAGEPAPSTRGLLPPPPER